MDPKTNEADLAKALVDKLRHLNLDITREFAEEIKSRKETVPYLLEILDDEKALYDPEDWALFHAMHLLGAMKVYEAVPKVLEMIKEDNELIFGDWTENIIPSFFYSMGPLAVDSIIRAIKDNSLDWYPRCYLSTSLVIISRDYPNTREKIVECFREIITDYLNNSREDVFISFIAEDVSSLQDKEIFGLVEKAYEKGLVSDDITDFHYSLNAFETGDIKNYEDITRDIMSYFDKENMDYLKRIDNCGNPEIKVCFHTSKSKKIGRNDPCICGSGKKYKKCCLGK